MEQFFVRVLTAVIASDAVKTMLAGMLHEVAIDIKKDIQDSILSVEQSVESLERTTMGNLDAMDGKVGNLQEQLTGIPGQIITSILDALKGLNPLGGLFGQQ